MKISKKQFYQNISEFVWEGNGRYNLKEESALLFEPVNDTFTRWIEEWVGEFNKLNGKSAGFIVECVIMDSRDGYEIRRVPVSYLEYPKSDKVEDEEYDIEDEDEAGEITKESCIDNE